MTEQNRRIEDKRAAGPLSWGEHSAAAPLNAVLTGNLITAAPALAPDIVMHGLRITKDGINYNGQEIKDAGAVHAALLEVLSGKPLPATAPASADNPSTPEFSERDIPADAPRAFARRYTALLEENRKLKAAADNPSTAGAGNLSKDRIAEVGLKLRIQAFENAKFRADEGSAMTGPEQDEFNQQVEFARAIWRLAAPVAQSTAGAVKGGITSLEGLTRYGVGGDGELQEMVCGDAYLVADVEALLAAPAAQAPTPTAAESLGEAPEVSATDLAIQRACRDLPDNYEISIELESGCGCVLWRERGGDWHAIEGEGFLSDDIDEAFERAVTAASKDQSSAKAPPAREVPLWDENGEPWNLAAEQVEYERAQAASKEGVQHG